MAGVQRLGERGHRERLGEPGHALEQHVAVGEQADQQPVEHVALADDDLLHRPDHVRTEMPRPADFGAVDPERGRRRDACAVLRIRRHLLASGNCWGPAQT